MRTNACHIDLISYYMGCKPNLFAMIVHPNVTGLELSQTSYSNRYLYCF